MEMVVTIMTKCKDNIIDENSQTNALSKIHAW